METNFGLYIKELRLKKGLTLTQMAAKVDLDSANLSKIENGIRRFDKNKLKVFSETLEVNYSDLEKEHKIDCLAQFILENNCTKEDLALAQKIVQNKKSIVK